jgi:CO/xanthine dehydrogenase Mo-binding subunit
MTEYNYIGAKLPRYDGQGQVSGKTVYVDDVSKPGMLYVKVFRSPVHKGVVKNIDASETLKVPGVVGIVTAKDVPGINVGWFGDVPVFAENIRYKGQVVAGVVAKDEDTAAEGVAKLKVDIEEQTPVFDMFEAIKPGAPLVDPAAKSNYFEGWPKGNTFKLILGDVEQGFKEADYIVEGDYSEGVQDHASMEPHASVAYLDEAGRLCVHTTSQCLAFQLRSLMAVFNRPLSQIRYIGGVVGGGFGGKNEIHTDHIAGVAALKFGKPIKYRETRREDLRFSTKRGAWAFHFKDGVKKDGRLVARYVEHWHDSGAYNTFSSYGIEKGSMFLSGPYWIPNILIEGHLILTNKPVSSSMRGYTSSNGQYASEVQMTKIAQKLGLDPWEIRFVNAWRDGDLGASRYEVKGAGSIEAMKKTAELAGITLPENLMQMSSRRR